MSMGWQSHLSTLALVENEAMPLAPPPLEKGRSVREADRVGIASRASIDPHPPRPAQCRARRPPLFKGRWSKRHTRCQRLGAEAARPPRRMRLPCRRRSATFSGHQDVAELPRVGLVDVLRVKLA